MVLSTEKKKQTKPHSVRDVSYVLFRVLPRTVTQETVSQWF